jgi:glutathione S-transferase
MDLLTLVIGTRNYSSWSLRPWILLRHLGLPFSERQFHLDTPEFDAEVPKFSPTRRVPVLMHGELRIWESLAICEYASELAGGRGWPADTALRAAARSRPRCTRDSTRFEPPAR